MKNRRKNGWEQMLSQYTSARFDRKRKWGEADCCLFVADWVKIVTDVDIAEFFRGRYSTKKRAYQLLGQYSGGGNFVETICLLMGEYGLNEVRPKLGQRGDIAMVLGDYGEALGIISSNGREILVQGKLGLEVIKLENALKCWRVG